MEDKTSQEPKSLLDLIALLKSKIDVCRYNSESLLKCCKLLRGDISPNVYNEKKFPPGQLGELEQLIDTLNMLNMDIRRYSAGIEISLIETKVNGGLS